MCNYIFTYLSTVIFLLVKLIWKYLKELRDYCSQFYSYYNENQLPIVGRITALKDMGFGLAAIGEMLDYCFRYLPGVL